MMKTATIDAVMNCNILEGVGSIMNLFLDDLLSPSCTLDENATSHLPKIQIIVGTKALQYGVNGNIVHHAFKKGFPSNPHEMNQEFERVDRQRVSASGKGTMEVHFILQKNMVVFLAAIVFDQYMTN